jgi:hypothetical protein
MRIIGIGMFILLGVTAIMGLAVIDDTLVSIVLGVCAFIGGSVSAMLAHMQDSERTQYYKEKNNTYEKVIRLLNEEIVRLKSEVLNKIK